MSLSPVGSASEPAPRVWRRLFHIAAGSYLPLLGIFLQLGVMVPLLAGLSGLAIVVETSRFVFPTLNRLLVSLFGVLLKGVEARKVTGATYMIVAALGCFTFYDKGAAVSALFFLSLGDPVAALVGERVGGPRLWGKSPWGTLAFFGVALATVGVLSGSGAVEFHWALIVGAAVASLVELIPLPVDDNLAIPLLSGVIMAALGMGWRG